jgi:hypothetical protein
MSVLSNERLSYKYRLMNKNKSCDRSAQLFAFTSLVKNNFHFLHKRFFSTSPLVYRDNSMDSNNIENHDLVSKTKDSLLSADYPLSILSILNSDLPIKDKQEKIEDFLHSEYEFNIINKLKKSSSFGSQPTLEDKKRLLSFLNANPLSKHPPLKQVKFRLLPGNSLNNVIE